MRGIGSILIPNIGTSLFDVHHSKFDIVLIGKLKDFKIEEFRTSKLKYPSAQSEGFFYVLLKISSESPLGLSEKQIIRQQTFVSDNKRLQTINHRLKVKR